MADGASQGFEVEPLSANIGARIRGVDLRESRSAAQLDALYEALLRYKVLFLRDQTLDDEEHKALGAHFGKLTVYPVIRIAGGDQPLETIVDDENSPPKADHWHTDITFLEVPPKLAFLYAQEMPEAGGDTMWCSLSAAYQALSKPMQDRLRGLSVHHGVGDDYFPKVEAVLGKDVTDRVRKEIEGGADHPLITRHPETGEEVLYFAGSFVRRINDLSDAESRMLIDFLAQHVDQAEFAVRWRWRVGDLAIWDERCTLHRALGDHYPARRRVRRCTVDGDGPPIAA